MKCKYLTIKSILLPNRKRKSAIWYCTQDGRRKASHRICWISICGKLKGKECAIMSDPPKYVKGIDGRFYQA